jgi:hypothetical protein
MFSNVVVKSVSCGVYCVPCTAHSILMFHEEVVRSKEIVDIAFRYRAVYEGGLISFASTYLEKEREKIF